MSFHISTLGSFAGKVSAFADLNGFIPETGESHSEFEWDSLCEWDDNAWAEFLALAIAATASAEDELNRWR